DREHRFPADSAEQVLRHFDGDRPAGIDEPERVRLIAGRNEPKLHRLLLLSAEQCGWNDGERAAARVYRSEKPGLSAFGAELRDERCTWRYHGADIDQGGKTPLQVRSCSKQGLAKRRGFAIYLHALPPARPCREL